MLDSSSHRVAAKGHGDVVSALCSGGVGWQALFFALGPLLVLGPSPALAQVCRVLEGG